MTDERMSPDVRLREEERMDLASALREHQAVATGLGEWACKCSPREWRPSAYRSIHMADGVTEAVERIVAARVGEVVERVEAVLGLYADMRAKNDDVRLGADVMIKAVRAALRLTS